MNTEQTSENVFTYKFSFLIQIIKDISNFMSYVVKLIKEKLISALFHGFPISDELGKLLFFPCKLGEWA